MLRKHQGEHDHTCPHPNVIGKIRGDQDNGTMGDVFAKNSPLSEYIKSPGEYRGFPSKKDFFLDAALCKVGELLGIPGAAETLRKAKIKFLQDRKTHAENTKKAA